MASTVALRADEVPELEQDEEVLYRSEATRLIDNEADSGPGRLWVTSRRLVWVRAGNLEWGTAWSFRGIALHAISRASESFPFSCVYIQLGVFGADDDEDVMALPPAELRFVPANDLAVQELFDAMSRAAALNPDPMDMDDDNADDGANDFDPTNRLMVFENMLNNADDDDRFADADDDDGDNGQK